METVLHTFPECDLGQSCGDGSYPDGRVIEDSAGNLYGTTFGGGTYQCDYFASVPGNSTQSCGTVFEVSSEGVESVLLSFDGSNGDYPLAGLIEDTSGSFYGTTYLGGDYVNDGGACPDATGCGVVFKLTSSGQETALYQFCQQNNCADGALPEAALVMDNSGNLFGTTAAGGTGTNCGEAENGCGTVFKLAADGTETVLYAFCGLSNCADGEVPSSPLIMDSSGVLYGTTNGGGSHGGGTVFSLNATTGAETVLYSFCRRKHCKDGENPAALIDVNGTLYGTTYYGGAGNATDCDNLTSYGCGTVFSFNPKTGAEKVLYSFCSQPGCTDGANPEGALIQDGKRNFVGMTVWGGNAGCGGYGCGTVFEIER